MAAKRKKAMVKKHRGMSAQFHRDWYMMMLGLLGAGLAVFIGMSASSTASHKPQVAGDSTSVEVLK